MGLQTGTRKGTSGGRKTAISLFSGGGGFDLGFHWAGFNTRVMVEWEAAACETLRLNFTKDGFLASSRAKRKAAEDGYRAGRIGTEDYLSAVAESERAERELNGILRAEGYEEPVIMQRDIRTLSSEEILAAAGAEVGEIDAVIGGPPCQGYSHANNCRFIDDPRNSLYKEFVRVVRDIRPMYFSMENVKGLATIGKRGEVIRQVVSDFAKCGYQVTWTVQNAADFGVPQNRVRLIIMGVRTGLPQDDFDGISAMVHEAMIAHDRLYADRWAAEALKEARKAVRSALPGFRTGAVRGDGDVCDVVAVGTDRMGFFDGSEGEHSTEILCDGDGTVFVQCYCDGEMVEHDPGLACAVEAGARFLSGAQDAPSLVSEGGFAETVDGSFVIPFAYPVGKSRRRPHVVLERSGTAFRAEVRDYPDGANAVPKSMLGILEAAAAKAFADPL